MLQAGRRTFWFLCSLAFILSFSVQATAALLPTLAEYFQKSPIVTGRLVWAYMIPYGIFALIWSPLSRKFSVKKILIFCLTAFSLAALTVTFSFSLRLAFLGRLGMGIFGSATVPLSLIVIGKEYSGKDRPKRLGLFFSTSYFSGLIGVFLSGILPWRFIYGISFFLSLIAAGLGLFYLNELDYRGKFRISYRDTFADKESLKLFIFIFVLSFFYHSVHQWLGVYLSQGYGISQFLISSILTVSAFAAIFSESLGGFLASRFGSQNIAAIGLVSMAVFLLAALFTGSYQAVFFLILFWGMGWAFNHVGLSSFLAALPDKFLRDASSLNSSLRFISGGAGAYFGGIAVSKAGFVPYFAVVAAVVLITAFLIKKSLIVNTG